MHGQFYEKAQSRRCTNENNLKITEKSSHSEPVSNKIHNMTETETIKQEKDKQSRKKTLQPSQSLPVVDEMENTGRKTPSLVGTEEEECFLEPWNVVSIMSLSGNDEMESMSDEEPSTVETVEKCPKETLTVDSTAPIPVAVGEMENLTDEAPSPDNTGQECIKGPSTVEPTTAAPLFDEMDNYAADAVCKVPDFAEDMAKFKVHKKVLQEKLYQVGFFLFALRFQSNQTEWKR